VLAHNGRRDPFLVVNVEGRRFGRDEGPKVDRGCTGSITPIANEFTSRSSARPGSRVYPGALDACGGVGRRKRGRRFDSPFRQLNLAGIHVDTDELCQLDRWFALASALASESVATNGESTDHAHFKDPRNGITNEFVDTVYLLKGTGVLKNFDQRTPAGRILLCSRTRGHLDRMGTSKRRGKTLGSRKIE
jgi:hypothetical protein